MGDGVAWTNLELKLRLVRFKFINRQWYVALNPFFDAGAVVQPYRLERMKEVWNDTRIPVSERALIYSGLDEQFT